MTDEEAEMLGHDASAHLVDDGGFVCAGCARGPEQAAAFMEAARGMREALEAMCLMQARNYGDGIRTHLEFIGLADEGRDAIATFDATLGEQ